MQSLDKFCDELNGVYSQHGVSGVSEIVKKLSDLPDDASKYLNVAAIFLLDKGEQQEAITIFETALSLPSPDPLIYLNVARFHVTEGQYFKAKRRLSEYETSGASTESELYLELAYLVSSNIGQSIKARAYAEELFSTQESHKGYLHNLMRSYIAIANARGVIDLFERYCEVTDLTIDEQILVSTALWQLGDKKQSVEFLQQTTTGDLAAQERRFIALFERFKHLKSQKQIVEYACNALLLRPSPQNLERFAQVLFNSGSYQAAMQCLDGAINTNHGTIEISHIGIRATSQNSILLRILILLKTNPAEAYQSLQRLMTTDDGYHTDIAVAALGDFMCHLKLGASPSSFCPKPIDQVAIYERWVEKTKIDIDHLWQELSTLNFEYEPLGKTTSFGSQTKAVAFQIDTPQLALLKEEIERAVYLYRENLPRKYYIYSRFPDLFDIFAWAVKVDANGFQDFHIHSNAWVSGVLYFDTMAESEGGEINFLNAFDGFEDDILIEKCHRPSSGDLVLFPSSTFHSTNPNNSNKTRRCLAFDIKPVKAES